MLRKVLLIASVVCFAAFGLGIGVFAVGTASISLLGFGLALFAGSFLAK